MKKQISPPSEELKKQIKIPREILVNLKIQAAKENKNLSAYITSVLVAVSQISPKP